MYLRNIFKLKNNFSIQAKKQFQWKFNHAGAEIYMKSPNGIYSISFQILPNIKISHFLMAFQIDQRSVVYPSGINSDALLLNFLLGNKNAQAIQIKWHGQKLFLRNKACDTISNKIIQTLKEPGFYQDKINYQKQSDLRFASDLSNYLTRYYLKLQAEGYCKKNKIDLKGVMTTKIKQDIIHYLNRKNQINCQDQIITKLKEQGIIRNSIQQTQQKISKIHEIYNKKQNWYKRIAILITSIHLFSFGYMIFFVDWLGWDIIEPLTYTVGVAYTLLGIRFYRKYSVNRSSQSIKQALFRMLMSTQNKTLLKSNQVKLQIYKKQLKKVQQDQNILKNKLSYQSSLINSLRNSI